MHRQNLAKRCSAPPGQFSVHPPYHRVEHQGQHALALARRQPLTQDRFLAFLRQPSGYNHPPSTHTPAPSSRRVSSSPARCSPLARTADSPPPPEHDARAPAADMADLVPQREPVEDRPRPIYDFPSEVIMTEQIRTTRDSNANRMLNQYQLVHRLGRGQHGDVYKGYDMTRGNMVVAIKACRRKGKDRMEELRQKNAMERAAASGEGRGGLQRMAGGGGVHLVDRLQSAERKVLREIAIMKKCKHGQIVQLLEVIDDRLTSKIFMVMEYMGGGEVKWRDSASPNALPVLRVDQARRICRDVILGLEYLHHQGIIHRDIKPANLLWTADRRGVKITDFGVSHFSYAQRLKSVRASEAYRRAVQNKKERLEREREERERLGRAQHWRLQGKGKNRGAASAGGSTSLSGRATPKMSVLALSSSAEKGPGDEADDEDDADILEELEGTPDPLLLDDGGLSRQAGTPSFLAPEIVWEFRKEHQDALVRRIGGAGAGGMGPGSTSATAGTSANPLGAGWYGGTRSRSGSEAAAPDEEGSTSANANASAALLATHPAPLHSHSPVRMGEARSRSASNPNPEPGQNEKELPAIPGEQQQHVLVQSTVGVNVIPPSEFSELDDEPGPGRAHVPPSPSPTPSSSARDSPVAAFASPFGHTPTATATNTAPSNSSFHPESEAEAEASVADAIRDAPRPPITKAIDVWALGVTLYCLLFASCPWTGANEFVLYHAVHAQDFHIPETMGYDRIPTGPRGRVRVEGEREESEGAVVVWLLERLLEKDVEKRITLDEVKRLPWITRDIPDPEAWLRETSPQRHDPINVTAADESDAMSVVKFTWKKPVAASSPRSRASGSGLNRIAKAGGRMIKNLLPGRQRPATAGRSLQTLEDADENDLAVSTDAGGVGGWGRSKSRVDLLAGSKNKGKGKETDDAESAASASSVRRTPSRRRRLVQDAVERVTRSGSTRSARSSRRRGKLPELKLSMSHSRDSSLSRPGSRAQTPDPRHQHQRMHSPLPVPPYAVYATADELVGPLTPRARGDSTSALTSPASTGDLSSDDILDEDDERVLEERERARREALALAATEAATKSSEADRVSRRTSIQKFLSFGRQRSSRSSLAEQNKKGKQRARAGTMGAAGADAGTSRTFLGGLSRRSEDDMRMSRGPGPSPGASAGTSYAAAAVTSSMGLRTGSGPALGGGGGGMGLGLGLGVGMGMGMGGGLSAGTAGFDADGPLTSGELTNAMRAQSWEGAGGVYASRPEDYDLMSDYDAQSVVYDDEDVRMVGAGGVLSNPGTVPGSPASQSHSRSNGSISAQIVDSIWLPEPASPAYGHGLPPPVAPIHIHPHAHAHPLNIPPGAGAGGGQYTTSSPLARAPLTNAEASPFDDEQRARPRRVDQILQIETRSPSRERDRSRESRRLHRIADPGYVRYGEEDENSSLESGERVYGQGQTTLQDDMEDSGSDGEERVIVVRRRRPSESLARSRSQVRRDEE